MATSGREVVIEGWLTKSPPTKRIWRAKWRRRWFSLKHSGDIPNQYILTYYVDRNCRHLKGSINLDDCEQVDLGLKLDKKKLKFDHVFDIKTPTRTYYLAAESENDMRSWVNCICKVCGLKSTNDEEDLQNNPPEGVGAYTEEKSETSPISPVSTSPYIPIFECFTGNLPVLSTQNSRDVIEQNRRNSNRSDNEQIYINDPQFYDCPRSIKPMHGENDRNKNNSPLQSPTDTDSVFTDDDNGDLDVSVSQKFIKNLNKPPPRPPKIGLVPPSMNYMNLSPIKLSDCQPDETTSTPRPPTADETYDFPRLLQSDADVLRNSLQRRRCYNNAMPVRVDDGHVFRYDISPKPAAAPTSFRYDFDEDEPASPHSQSSGYSNLPSPGDAPPTVRRELKPRRKLSDSPSCGSAEPGSPLAPCVDRKLKPTTPLQEMRKRFAGGSPTLSHSRRQLSADEDRRRAAPSPALGRSHESLLQGALEPPAAHALQTKMQYLDLDLDVGAAGASFAGCAQAVNESSTVYKKVDFEKTLAFNVTKNMLEKERKEPVKFIKK